MSAAANAVGRRRIGFADAVTGWLRRSPWIIALVGLLIVFLAITKLLAPNYGAPGIQALGISILPNALAAVAQAVIVISGGITKMLPVKADDEFIFSLTGQPDLTVTFS